MSKIQSIQTKPFHLAMRSSLKWGAHSQLDKLEHVLIQVQTDDGHVGQAEAPVRPTIYGETVQSVETIVEQHLAPRLLGLDINDAGGITQALHSVANNQTARGAVDIAIHEVRAKVQDSSLLETHQGTQERIHVSYILGIRDLGAMLADARRVFEHGVHVLKVKVGRDAEDDERILSALNTEFAGTDVILYADANECLSVNNAAKELESLAKLGVAYVEEPLPIEHVKARAALKRDNILPIIADDSCFSPRDLTRELELNTFDILNIKPARTGFTDSETMLKRATDAGKGVMIGSQASSSLGAMHCAIFASKTGVTHPSEVSFCLNLHDDTLDEPLQFQDGWLELSSLQNKRCLINI